jgi:6-pyruvoyltetrahydropterin/6-carboxytetrahydropterin synthase
MELRISKEFEFAASHILDGLPAGHKCGRLHGHSYRVLVTLIGVADEFGFIMDFGELTWVRNFIADRIDHTHLNDVLSFNPTAENLATWLAGEVRAWLESRPERSRISNVAIGISEARSTWATCTIPLPVGAGAESPRAAQPAFSAV